MQYDKKNVFISSALTLCVFAIFALGMMMIFNTTSAEILDSSKFYNIHYAPIKHLGNAIIGLIGIAIIQLIGYKTILQMGKFIFIVSTILLLLVFVPGIGKNVNGASRWLTISNVSVQPSDIFLYACSIYYVNKICTNKGIANNFLQFFLFMTSMFIPIFLLLLEPNNSSLVIVGLILAQLFFITNVKKKFWLWPLVVFTFMGIVASIHLPYVSSRIHTFLHPEDDIRGKGHQLYQAKIATGSGKIFGKGLGNSLQKFSYLPEAQNDFIAAIFAEELGFVGIIFLISMYMGILYFGTCIANKSHDIEGFYLASSITFTISIQAFLNLAVVSGLLPSTGMNLPFFSQGGTSLVLNMLGIGILLSILKNK